MGGAPGKIVHGIFEGDDVAKAAGRAAMAQQSEARAAYNETKGIVNPATVQGLLSFDRDIKNQEKNLARQEQLISQIDPTILEASQQALKLLRGEQSSTLAPIQRQRDQQRQKLLNQLREQLGPGAETSTAGIQALTRFDAETNNLMAGQQQSAIQMLGNTAGQFNSVRPDMFREIMGLSNFGQGKTQLQYQQAAALSNARQGLMQTAGAQYTQDLIKAQGAASYGRSLHESGMAIGEAWATMGMGGGKTKVGDTSGGGGNNRMMSKLTSG